MSPRSSTWLVVAMILAGCGSDDEPSGTGATGSGGSSSSTSAGGSPDGGGGPGGAGGGGALPPPAEDWTRDLVSTALELDLGTLAGKATIVLAAAESTAASFEIGDLRIGAVSDLSGALEFSTADGRLDVGVPSTGDDATVIVEYSFSAHDGFDGWMPDQGVTFLWPTFCGNLFPCKSSPAEGLTFTMQVTGVEAGSTAVYPATIPADAPSYMPAVAVAPFVEIDLGATAAGTELSVWHLPGEEAQATAGTAHLREVFSFYETTYGPYPFGKSAGSVSADWGGGAYGGMEHHPYWHVSSESMDSEEVHAHEAAHGWYGDGVRISCWEDFVLSEGTVSYMAAHALEQVGVDLWQSYECQLKAVCTGDNTVALLDTCNEIDLLTHPLWSPAPYMKGAFFFRDVADAIGAPVLDQALAEFYAANVGSAARMNDLIEHVKTKTDAAGAASVDALATDWLTTLACPVDPATLCL